MKRTGYLYEQIVDPSNMSLAYDTAVRKTGHSYLRNGMKNYYIEHKEELFPKVLYYANRFVAFKHESFTIYENSSKKTRNIIVPTMNEIILQHGVINILEPYFMKWMYRHSYASIKGRGTLKGQKRVRKWITKDPDNTRYYLKMDIHHFFDSIDQEILIEKLQRKFKDNKLIDLLKEIIHTTESGLPLGFYTSQWFANFYLTDLDHYIKEKLHATYYIRYMDDMVIFGSNKRELKKMLKKINAYVNEKLHLQIKNNVELRPLMYVNKYGELKGRDLDFLGFRFYRDHITMRKHIMLSISRKASNIKKTLDQDKEIDLHDAMSMLSYYGWIKHTDSHGFYEKYVQDKVPLKLLKKIVRDAMRKGQTRRFCTDENKVKSFVNKNMTLGLNELDSLEMPKIGKDYVIKMKASYGSINDEFETNINASKID